MRLMACGLGRFEPATNLTRGAPTIRSTDPLPHEFQSRTAQERVYGHAREAVEVDVTDLPAQQIWARRTIGGGNDFGSLEAIPATVTDQLPRRIIGRQ